MKLKLYCLTSVFVFSVLLILSVGYVQAQTPGQVPVFDQPGTGACNNSGGNDCIDSVITQAGGNIGIGTTTPAAALDVASGDLNLAGNLLKGGALFLHNFGSFNTFLGLNAGNRTMTGSFNTASGSSALYSNTTGGGNTASGSSALQANTGGNSNTAVGASTLENNTTGSNNTAAGYGAMILNTTGVSNTAIGVLALYNNTTGANNTASGMATLGNNTTGGANTASGSSALASNTTGSDNTASGDGALLNNTSGVFNNADGVNALLSNTTGLGNTGIGFGADVSQGALSNATAIGYNAVVNASNKIRLGNTAVTVVEGPPYSTVSDKNKKENFKPIDAEEVLRKIRGMNVTSWNYIGQEAKQFRHYGPVAQDFFAAFGDDGVGTIGSPTTITSTDMDGVLMLAVKALGQENAELKARIEALEQLVKGRE